jgi:Glutamate/Leucine/Phenylalanine/Valine dehydrogenase
MPGTTNPGEELLAGALQSWVQSRAQFYWELDEVERRLEIYMRRAMESVLAKAKAYDSSYREAAFILAVERVAKAIEQRGIFPSAFGARQWETSPHQEPAVRWTGTPVA